MSHKLWVERLVLSFWCGDRGRTIKMWTWWKLGHRVLPLEAGAGPTLPFSRFLSHWAAKLPPVCVHTVLLRHGPQQPRTETTKVWAKLFLSQLFCHNDRKPNNRWVFIQKKWNQYLKRHGHSNLYCITLSTVAMILILNNLRGQQLMILRKHWS